MLSLSLLLLFNLLSHLALRKIKPLTPTKVQPGEYSTNIYKLLDTVFVHIYINNDQRRPLAEKPIAFNSPHCCSL